MTQSDYERILREGITRFGRLHDQREEIDVELTKLRQFLYVTINMVPDERRPKLQEWLDAVVGKVSAKGASLAESIRKIFKDNPHMVYSTGGIRDELRQRGFDFSGYKSNPLSSIATTLRRMVETGELVTSETEEGSTMFMPPLSGLETKDEQIRPLRPRRR